MNFKKPKGATHIKDELWTKFSKREQYYIILLFKRKYTRTELRDMLLFNSYVGLNKLRDRVRRKIKETIT